MFRGDSLGFDVLCYFMMRIFVVLILLGILVGCLLVVVFVVMWTLSFWLWCGLSEFWVLRFGFLLVV